MHACEVHAYEAPTYEMHARKVLSARTGIVQPFILCRGASVIVAYTSDGYLRDAYR